MVIFCFEDRYIQGSVLRILSLAYPKKVTSETANLQNKFIYTDLQLFEFRRGAAFHFPDQVERWQRVGVGTS